MLNIAGPEYDFGSVVFVVLEECEHRRRGFDEFVEPQLEEVARAKLAKIRAAYDEFGGSPVYWESLENEVMKTAMPQYTEAAQEMNRLERSGFDVYRGGDVGSRLLFALLGLIVGSILIALPFIPIFEAMFAFALTFIGFVYPDLKRYQFERRHYRLLNRLVVDANEYQRNAKLHYMTTTDIRQSFTIGTSNTSETTTTETKELE